MKRLLFLFFIAFSVVATAQITFQNGGSTIDVYFNNRLKDSFQKSGLAVTETPQKITLIREGSRFVYEKSQIETPNIMDSIVAWLGSMVYDSVSAEVGYFDTLGVGIYPTTSRFEVKNLIKFNEANYNTFVGRDAALFNIGTYITAIGHEAGVYSGSNNVYVGAQAGCYNTSGGSNVFIGKQAGYYSTGSVGNTFIGYLAGRNVNGGDYNVCIGYLAGYNETGSNKLYIANSATTTPLIYGEFDNKLLKVNGVFGLSSTTITADYTASDVCIIFADASSNDITITLPAASARTGYMYRIKVIANNGNTNTVTIHSDDTIDGVTDYTLTTQYDAVDIISDGSKWYIF